MNYLVITDTHLGHKMMHKYCNRPLGFEQTILNNLDHYTHPNDVLLHLGDVCVYDDEYWNEKLLEANNGKAWLIKGNHDRKSNSWYLKNGWDFVADSIQIRAFGLDIALSHRPITEHDNFDINVHGHHHNTRHHPEDEVSDKHKLIFVEHDYTPLNLRKVLGK